MMTEIEAYIRQSAAQHGIDPDIAVRVAMSEGGLNDPVRQSDYRKRGYREPSYGPFQLLIGGPGTGFGGGLGNRALAAGIDPRNPEHWQKAIDFALAEAGKRGWGQWYGAAKAGIGNYQGIGAAAGKAADVGKTVAGDANSGLHVSHPPNPTVGTGGYIQPGADAAPVNPFPVAPDKKTDPWRNFGTAIAGIGGGDGGYAGMQVPQLPIQAGYSTLPAMPTIDPQAAMNQRNELAMAMARLNSGRLWG